MITVKTSQVKPNPRNPRVIKDDKFQKLVKSIQEFPQMLEKQNATGGNTTGPDYGATMDSCNNSMLVYPAWRNVHGVTPIVPTATGGYRNSLVFYPLKAFNGLE
jgi:hypothetical protein